MSTRKRPDEDFEREIRAHLELEAEQLRDEGLSDVDARRRARLAFGNATRARERFFEAHRWLAFDRLQQDLRCAVRNIRRYPVAAAVAVASLGAGIGATTATLTIRDAIFRKMPRVYRDPASLARVQIGRPDRPLMPLGNGIPGPLYAIWQERFGEAIGASSGGQGPRDVRTADRSESVPVRAITPGLFAVLGVNPIVGRIPAPSERSPAGPAATSAVLSYRMWQRLFDGRPDVAGQVVWIQNRPHTVLAVMPERFWFSDMDTPIWTFLDATALAFEDGLDVVIRRPEGMTEQALYAQLAPGLTAYARTLPANDREWRMRVSGLEGTPLGKQMAIVLPYVLGTSVLLTLLIACANAAILMIAQWTAREHEIAIRASIGAGRGRIVRALLTESVVVAAGGGVLGVAATFALRRWIISQIGANLTFFDLSIDPRVLLQVAVITIGAGLLAGAAPALSETRRLHVNPLRTMATSDRVRQRWRHALVLMEIVVTVALLVQTVALVDGYRRTRDFDLGYDTHPLISIQVENPHGVPGPQLMERLRSVPGIVAVGGATTLPFANVGGQTRVASSAAGSDAVVAEQAAISPEYLGTMGVAMRAGRGFAKDQPGGAAVAIVNETLAHRLFGGGTAIGNRVWLGRVPYDVVGVAADYATNPLRTRLPEPRVFIPLPASSTDLKRFRLLVRASGDPAPLVRTVRREVEESHTGTIVANAFTIDQVFDVMGQEILVGTAPLFPLIAIGMLLTTAGIYGVLAFAVARRSRELAVRVAIGATGRDLVRLVSAHTARLVAIGCGLGIAVTFGLSRIVRASGGAGSVFDPEPYVFVTPLVMLGVIAIVATWIPSRRALKIDPAVLLKTN